MYGCSKDCLILIPLRLPQISSFTLSLKCFSSDSDNCPNVGIRPPDSVPPPTEDRSSPTNTPVFPPSSFILPSFGWFYVFFSTGQVLLSVLSWCSACTSASEGVFLMYPWRERYSTSTCSFTILFSPQNIGNSDKCYSMDETWRHAKWNKPVIQFSHSCVWLFETPGTAAHQASLSINKSWSLFKFMSIKLEFQLQHQSFQWIFRTNFL